MSPRRAPRARRWAGRLDPVAAPQLRALLDAAGLVVGETSGLDPEQRALVTGRARTVVAPDDPRRRALDADTSLAAEYVGLAIDCEHAGLRDAVDRAAIRIGDTGVPLMRFRLAICDRPVSPGLGELRRADPRFTDTLPWEARREMVGSPTRAVDLTAAIELFSQARDAFPASTAIAMSWSHAQQMAEAFEEALRGFEGVLAGSPDHRDALLGVATNLSYLGRHAEAVAAASRLIALGTWHQGDARYWRAWNQYQLRELGPAWADVEVAITLLSSTNVYMLAGLIAHARQDLPTALARFERAYEIDGANCDAAWMAGLVHVDREEWPPAAPKFSTAMSCFASAASRARADLSAFDAEAARQGGTPAEVAAAHPRMKEKAEALRAAIEKLK